VLEVDPPPMRTRRNLHREDILRLFQDGNVIFDKDVGESDSSSSDEDKQRDWWVFPQCFEIEISVEKTSSKTIHYLLSKLERRAKLYYYVSLSHSFNVIPFRPSLGTHSTYIKEVHYIFGGNFSDRDRKYGRGL
jgi:hypothetical protein